MKHVEYLKIEKATDIPVIHCVIKDDNDQVINEGWLAPFRAYCFQVSGTPTGQGDKGSSFVIGLKHCIDINTDNRPGYQSNCGLEGISKELLLGQALIAITKWAGKGVDLGQWDAKRFPEPNQMAKFIDASYEWLKGL